MGTVYIEEDNLIIENLVIKDNDIINYFRKLVEEDFEKNIIDALRLGIKALELTSTTKDVMFVENTFNQMKEKINQTLEDFLGTNGKFCQFFDENDKKSFISRIKDLISEQLDINNQDSAFYQLNTTLTKEFMKIQKNLGFAEGVEEEKKRGTQKGIEYESEIFSILNNLAKIFDDTAEMTGKTIGKLPKSKKGDLLITINKKLCMGIDKKIVLEVKDEPKSLKGKNNLFEELDEAIKNRDAQFGIFVWTKEAQIKSSNTAVEEIGSFRFYPPSKIICSIDRTTEEYNYLPLELAYKFARAELISQLKGEEIKIDIEKVKEIIKRAKNRIEQASNLKRSVTGIQKSLEKLQEDIDSLRTEGLEILNELITVVSP